ncbi:MAG: thioredoxin family protein [Ignavibacteriae bacterium]|nr:thioredoxin family protein [Ignavibacteriota bacterium]
MQFFGKTFRWSQVALTALIGFLSIEIILLTLQNRELKTQLAEAISKPSPQEILKVGERVDPFYAATLNGTTKEFQYDDTTKKYLLFIFSTTCSYCEKNLSNWKSIEQSLQNSTMKISWLSTHPIDKTVDYAAKNQLTTEVCVVDTVFARKYKVYGVPLTILINSQGNVEKVWRGLLKEEDVLEMKSLVGVA